MVSKIDSSIIYSRLGPYEWEFPRYMGPERYDFIHKLGDGSVIISIFPDLDSIEWIHASMTRKNRTPTYQDLQLLHKAVFGNNWAYQVFAPKEKHVNLHHHALHLWGRVDGRPVLPDFPGVFKAYTGIRSI